MLQVKAQLIAAGRLSRANGKAECEVGDMSTMEEQPPQQQCPGQGTTGNKAKQNTLITEEVDINDVSMSARNFLTRTGTQDEINKVMLYIYRKYCLLPFFTLNYVLYYHLLTFYYSNSDCKYVQMSRAYISTRGRYLTQSEVAALPANPPSNQRPLYLHIQGASLQDVKGVLVLKVC